MALHPSRARSHAYPCSYGASIGNLSAWIAILSCCSRASICGGLHLRATDKIRNEKRTRRSSYAQTVGFAEAYGELSMRSGAQYRNQLHLRRPVKARELDRARLAGVALMAASGLVSVYLVAVVADLSQSIFRLACLLLGCFEG